MITAVLSNLLETVRNDRRLLTLSLITVTVWMLLRAVRWML